MTATVHRRFDGPPRIAVLGGGMSGLAAAHRLTELVPRAELAVLEASARLGGVLETVQRDGFLIERSADSFLTSRPEGVALCERLGLADQLLPTDEKRRRALVVHRGRLLPIPAGFYLMSPRKLGSLLRSPVLSVRGKLRLLAEPLVRRRGSREQGASSGEPGAGSKEQGARPEGTPCSVLPAIRSRRRKRGCVCPPQAWP